MHTITLRQLHYTQVIAEEGHFGRAAARCRVTQPALSQQVKLLEDRCNTPLFERLGKSVRLTPFGRDFLARAARVLNAAQDLETFADMSAGHPARPLRFGLIPTVAPYLLPDILPQLKSDLPDIEFSISEGKTDRLIAALQQGDLDIALIATEPPPGGLFESVSLMDDPFVLAVPRGSALPDPVNLRTVPRDDFLLLEEGHCLRDQTLDACETRPDARGHAFAATSLTTIVELVASGYGVTLLPTISLRKEQANPRIAIHTLASPGAARTLRLIWRNAVPHDALFRRIATCIADSGMRALGSPTGPPAPQ